MTVSTNKKVPSPKAGSAQEERVLEPRPQEEVMFLELRKIKRYHHQNHLYVIDQVYKVTREQANALLQLTFNGRPVFARYKAKAAVTRAQVPQGPVMNDMTSTRFASAEPVLAQRIPNNPPAGIVIDDEETGFIEGLLSGELADEDESGATAV